jgi:hypothetical protein
LSHRKKKKSRDELGESIHRTTMRLVRKRLNSATSVEDAERILEAATSALKESLPKTLEDGALRIADSLDRRRKRLIKDRREREAGFERRLQQTWGDGFDRLEAHLHAFLEFGEMYYKDGVDADEPPTPALYKALSELHARSCRVVGEIVRLVRAGFADGAHARWRTLHEIAVVAQFLAKHGNAMAERYLLHDAVRACRAAERYAQHAETLGFEEISSEELQEHRSRRDALIVRYGKPFGTDFGWAAEQLKQGTPGLAHLETDIDLAHWRPFFGWASDPVHAGPGGLRPLGAEDHGKNYLLAGPSNAGLFDPAQYTVLSMGQILSALVAHPKENLTYLAMYMAFNEMGKRCQAALLAAHEFVEERTAKNRDRIGLRAGRKKRSPSRKRRRS